MQSRRVLMDNLLLQLLAADRPTGMHALGNLMINESIYTSNTIYIDMTPNDKCLPYSLLLCMFCLFLVPLNYISFSSLSLNYVIMYASLAYGFDLGVAHADDMPYLYYYTDQHQQFPWLESDDLTRRRICDMWTSFAKTFQPTPPGETVS